MLYNFAKEWRKTTTPTTRINFRFHAPFISPSSCQLLLSFWKIWFILSGFFFIPPQFFPRLPSFPHSQWEKERMCMQNMQKITNAFWSMSGREIGIACMQIHRDREDDKLSWNIEKLLHILLHIISRCRRSCCSCCLWNMWKYWNYDDNSHNILRERERERKNRFGCRIMMKDWECMHTEWFKVYDVIINTQVFSSYGAFIAETWVKLDGFFAQKTKI